MSGSPGVAVPRVPRAAWLPASLAIAVVVKLWLVQDLRLTALAGELDDLLFLRLANELLEGAWLGDYSARNLVKGPGYPFFIALAYRLGLPLLQAQHLFYALACGAVALALAPWVPSRRARAGLFLVLLFNPQTFNLFALRVSRESIYPALTLFVVAAMAGILGRLDAPVRRLAPWCGLLGISSAWFWITREEGLWLAPTALLLLGHALWRVRRLVARERRKRVGLLLAPVVLFLLCVGSVAAQNARHYGVFGTVELKTPEFRRAYGALTRVEHRRWRAMVPLPREARLRIYAVSPAFAQLAPLLEGGLGRGWARAGAYALPEGSRGEIGGGWFLWALRSAASARGHHASAEAASRYYEALASEVNAACDRGALSCGPRAASLAPPWRPEYIPLLPARAFEGLRELVSFDALAIREGQSRVGPRARAIFERITRNRLAPAGESEVGPASPKLEVLRGIHAAYRLVVPLAAIASVAAILVAGFRQLSRRSLSPLFVFAIAIATALGVRLLLLAYIDLTSFPSHRYLVPLYSQVILFCFCALATLQVPLPEPRDARSATR